MRGVFFGVGVSQTSQVKLLTLKLAGCICLSSFIGAHAQEVFEERVGSLETSYLESKDELEDYILGTGDVISIRFKNRPREGLKERQKKKEVQAISLI